jgi:hypothetical protein
MGTSITLSVISFLLCVDKAYCPESFIEFTHRENIRFYVAADLSA